MLMLATLATAALATHDVHCSEARLEAPSGVVFDSGLDLPESIDLEGRWAVLQSSPSNTHDLHTYEQDLETGAWRFRGTLSSIPGSWFGQDFQLERESDGTPTLMVGEPKWKNGGGVERGAVRVYEWDEVGEVWVEAQKILPPIPGTVRFGAHFTRDGDWAVIGSLSSGNGLYMYRRDPVLGTWSHHSTLDAPAEGFGKDTDLRGDLIVTQNTIESESYVFRRNANDEWLQESLFPFPLGRPKILSGEILNATLTPPNGKLQVIRQDPGTGVWWVAQVLDETWFPPGQYTSTYEFWDFSASEELVVANGPLHDGPNGETYAGRAFTFVRDPASGDWAAGQILERAVPTAYEEFGQHVAVDGTRALLVADKSDLAWYVDLDPTDCDGNRVPDLCELKNPLRDRNADGVVDACQHVGTVYCTPANVNSTGSPARLGGLGSAVLADANLDICADRMPPNEFGYLLASSAPGFIPNVGGSSGDLCIAGGPDFGRFTDQILSTGPLGFACTTVPLPIVPTAKGPHVLLPGETWYFQFWYRDGTTSNHTDGVEILFE